MLRPASQNSFRGALLGGSASPGGGFGGPQPKYEWDFANDKSLRDVRSGVVATFTRASTALGVGSNKLLQSFATNAARFVHDPVTGESLGLLVEPAATNLLLQSIDFDNASWSKSNTTITANNAVAPDGTTTMDKMVHTTGGADMRQTSATILSGTGTSSIFVKKGGHQWFRIILSDGTNSVSKWFDKVSGVVGATATAGAGALVGTPLVEDYGDHWRLRFSASGVTAAAVLMIMTNAVANASPAETSGGDGSHIWGAQIEAGAVATSPIITTTAQITRAKDVCVGSLLESIQNFTLLAEGLSLPVTSGGIGNVFFSVDDGDNSDRVKLEMNAAGDFDFETRDVGATQASVTFTPPTSTWKFAGRHTNNDFQAALDGTLGTPDTSGSDAFVNRAVLGAMESAGIIGQAGVPIAKAAIYDTPLADNLLQELTR